MFHKLNSTSILLLSLVTLSACNIDNQYAEQNVPIKTDLYLDNSFKNYQSYKVESQQEIFAIDDDMKEMVNKKLLPERNIKRRAKKLLKHIFSNNDLDIAYQSTANLIASDAYQNKEANCMSLTIMAYSLAKHAKLDVKFQDVLVPEYWSRNGEYNMLTGHVNLSIVEPKDPNKMIIRGELLEIDFDPYVVKRSFPKKVININTVVAMFYNNKGAQALVDKDYDQAYSYFKAATLTSPGFSPGWGNLGILYKLTGNLDYSLKAYDHAILLNNNNFTALNNTALLLRQMGQDTRAKNIEELLHKKRVANPYYHALLADEAFYRGNNIEALKHYRKAIRMDKSVHEFYFGLAKVYFALNEYKKAESAMKKALTYNKVTSTENTYIAKLNYLKKAGN